MRAVRTLLAFGVLASASVASDSARSASEDEKQKVFDRLISAIWCDQQVMIRTAFGDFTQWQLRPDGTYRYDLFTDTDPWPRGEGKWDLERSAQGWVLALDSGARQRIALDAGGWLRMDSMLFRPCQATGAATRDAASLPKVSLLPFVSALRDRVVGDAWHRVNDLDLGFRPTSIRLARDWTYASDYRFGTCQNSGTWAIEGREIVTHADRNPCDQRDTSYVEGFRLRPWASRDLVDGLDRYVRTPDPSRGAWTAARSEDSVHVTIEYPMPLKRGKPQRLRFTFVNKSGEALILERIALNTVYRDYRDRTRGLDTPELAALDLKSRPLPAYESAEFDLDVVFDRAGAQLVYFDTLVAGSRQNWDAKQARQVTVHP